MSDLVKVTQDESVCDTLNIPRLCLSSPLFLWARKKHTHTISKIGLSFATFTIVDTTAEEKATLKFDEILA